MVIQTEGKFIRSEPWYSSPRNQLPYWQAAACVDTANYTERW